MADTTTANYGFVKPEIDGDDGLWGGVLNSTFNQIDAAIRTVADAASAADAKAQAALDATSYEAGGGGGGGGAESMDDESSALPMTVALDTADITFIRFSASTQVGNEKVVTLDDILTAGTEKEFLFVISVSGFARVQFLSTSNSVILLNGYGVVDPTQQRFVTAALGNGIYVVRQRAVKALTATKTVWFMELVQYGNVAIP